MEPTRFEVFAQAGRIATQSFTTEDIIRAIIILLLFALIFGVIPYILYQKYK